MKQAKNFSVGIWARNLGFVSWQEIKSQIRRKIKFPLTKEQAYHAEH